MEEQGGVINVSFDDPPARFVITTNAPVRQVWISALGTSFKLDAQANTFVFPRTGEDLKGLVARLIREQLGEDADFILP